MRKSTQVAVGGLSAALCTLLMFLTGIMPFATYALPAISGVLLVSVVIENGKGTAWIVYFAVALLSVFIVPDKEAAMIFIVFFGYYPIIKEQLEKINNRFLEYFIKFAIFNLAIILSYSFIIKLIGAPDLLSEMGNFGKLGFIFLLALANFTFILYDFALTNLITLYINIIRPKILRKIK